MLEKIITAKAASIAAVATFLSGTAIGAWGMYKLYALGEIGRLEDYIEAQAEANRKTVENLQVLHQKQLKIANDNVRIERVVEYVPDNRECDLNPHTEQLLDVSRTGVSSAATGTNATVPRPAAITQRQQIESCARDGIQYRKLKANYDALRKWYDDNWSK